MGFKNIRFNKGENIVEIKIKDERGIFIEDWVVMMRDLPKWFNIICKKYGLNFQRDLAWAM